MALADPKAAAAKVTSEVAAARLYDRLVQEEADKPNDFAITAAIDDLERRFPDAIEGVKEFGGAEQYAESRSAVQRAQKAAGNKPKSAGGDSPAAKPAAASSPPAGGGRRAGTKTGGRPRTGTRGRAPSRGRRRGTARSAIEQTGIPGAARSTSAFLLQGLGIVVGLSVAYLLLRNAQAAGRGRAAVEQIAGGFARGVQLVVAPVDPLTPRRPRTLDPAKPGSLATGRAGDVVDVTNVPRLVPPPQLLQGRAPHGGRRRRPHGSPGQPSTR